jgi:ABC-type Mn2+/Zn2+ transport system permease subunit
VTAALFIQAAAPARRESRAGWVFVAGGGFSLLVLAKSPLGQEEVRRLMSSSLLGASAVQAWGLVALSALAALLVWRQRRRWTLALLDPDFASATGIDLRRFERGSAVVLALLLTLAVREAGFLFAFAALLLPAVAARRLSKRALPLWWLAPLLGALQAALGLALAHVWDLPPGLCAAAVMVLGAGLAPQRH